MITLVIVMQGLLLGALANMCWHSYKAGSQVLNLTKSVHLIVDQVEKFQKAYMHHLRTLHGYVDPQPPTPSEPAKVFDFQKEKEKKDA